MKRYTSGICDIEYYGIEVNAMKSRDIQALKRGPRSSRVGAENRGPARHRPVPRTHKAALTGIFSTAGTPKRGLLSVSINRHSRSGCAARRVEMVTARHHKPNSSMISKAPEFFTLGGAA